MEIDRTAEQPTFWEFVQAVKENPGGNEHWTPAYQYCDPCAFKYETIAHFEHLGGDGNEDHFLTRGPIQLKCFSYSFGLKNHLSFGLRFLTLK